MADCSGRTVKWATAEVLNTHSTRGLDVFTVRVDETETPAPNRWRERFCKHFRGRARRITSF
jgi:hypothetical protein